MSEEFERMLDEYCEKTNYTKSYQPILEMIYVWNHQQEKLDAKDKEIDDLRAIISDSLDSFKCTQKVKDYPITTWPRIAEKLLKGADNGMDNKC